MADTHKNFAKGTLTNSPGTAGTSFILGAGEGALFAANMPVTIVADQTQPDSTNAEIGYVTAVATDTLTITRAQQSTTAKDAQAGWLVLGTITAKALTDIETELDTHEALTAAHGTTGAVVGTTDTQTLTNKTLALGSNTVSGTTAQFNAANTDGDFATLAGTETLTNKTLTTPTISSTGFANANHAHTGSTSGGQLSITGATTGTLTVARGGTGATTLTGIVKGNGTSAFSAATAGTDYVSPSSTETLTNKTLDQPLLLGGSSVPSTPATGVGKLYGAGTGAVRPRFINSTGTQENIVTDQNPTWSDWTPTLTNLTLGNGTLVARYQQLGKTIHFYIYFTLGTTSAVSTAGTFSLPVTASSSMGSAIAPIGQFNAQDTGVANYYGQVRLESSTTVRPILHAAGGVYDQPAGVTATVPHTWGSGDLMFLQGTYEAA